MNDKDWQVFFALIDKIVDLPQAAADKKDLVLAKAQEFASWTNMDEFVSWFEE